MPISSWVVRAFAVLLVFLPWLGPATAESGIGIQWEIANRFRLFKDEHQFRGIVAAGLSRTDTTVSPALALELELEKRAEAGTLGFGQPEEVGQYGWAAAVDSHTCFLSRNFGHRGCKLSNGDEYLKPVHFDILVRLTGDTFAPGRTCVWTVAGLTPVTAECAQQVRIAGLSFATPFDLHVTENGSELAKLDGPSARSVVIVGFGDSFASGEGNPDRPAQFWDGTSDYHRTSRLPDGSGRVRYYPLRFGASPSSLGTAGSGAVWLNPQCHRSLYSHQLKAALQLAVEEPHVAVTYLGYACTGAEITTGILDFYAGRQNIDRSTFDSAPQLMKYLRDVCANNTPYRVFRGSSMRWQTIAPCRAATLPKPDAILVSIGGNDAGFSRVIAHETVDTANTYGPLRTLLYRLWLRTASPIAFADAEKLANTQYPARFPQLGSAIRKLVGPSPIIQVAYPQMTETAPDAVCPPTSGGLDVHEIFGWRTTTGSQAASFLQTLNGLLKDSIANTRDPAWTLVDSHVERFAGHAICQAGAPAGSTSQAMAGEMRFPVWVSAQLGWQIFDPTKWVAYSPRNRWFVTPNDAFLTGNDMDISSPKATADPRDPVQPLYAATVSGAFHPNALGQAAIADAALVELRRVLNLPEAPR